MQVDFFKFSEDVKPVKEFGLVDTPPAEINYDENQKDSWNAIVECNNRENYHFAPLDKKLKIMESFNKVSVCCILKNRFALLNLKSVKSSIRKRR